MKTGFHAWGSRPTARARWAHLLAERNFSDAHVAGKMMEAIRVCGREFCEAFGVPRKKAAIKAAFFLEQKRRKTFLMR